MCCVADPQNNWSVIQEDDQNKYIVEEQPNNFHNCEAVVLGKRDSSIVTALIDIELIVNSF